MEMDGNMCVGKKREHYAFSDIYNYLATKSYPTSVKDKGDKVNFRRATRQFAVSNHMLVYRKRQGDGSLKEVCGLVVFD